MPVANFSLERLADQLDPMILLLRREHIQELNLEVLERFFRPLPVEAAAAPWLAGRAGRLVEDLLDSSLLLVAELQGIGDAGLGEGQRAALLQDDLLEAPRLL